MNYFIQWNHILSVRFLNHILSKLVKINGKSQNLC